MHCKSERSHLKRGRREKSTGKVTSESALQSREEGVFQGPAKAVGTASHPASVTHREGGNQVFGALKGRVCEGDAFVIQATNEN